MRLTNRMLKDPYINSFLSCSIRLEDILKVISFVLLTQSRNKQD